MFKATSVYPACHDAFADVGALISVSGRENRQILQMVNVGNWHAQLRIHFQQSSRSVPDQLVVIQEGCVFDQAEALLHSVDKGLDLQVGHLVQWEEANASKYIQ